jgi:hypothetical protein
MSDIDYYQILTDIKKLIEDNWTSSRNPSVFIEQDYELISSTKYPIITIHIDREEHLERVMGGSKSVGIFVAINLIEFHVDGIKEAMTIKFEDSNVLRKIINDNRNSISGLSDMVVESVYHEEPVTKAGYYCGEVMFIKGLTFA